MSNITKEDVLYEFLIYGGHLMMTRIIIVLLTSILIASCATSKQPVAVGEHKQEYLNIYPDGRMEFKGRIMNEEDVVIYEDRRGGERAAVKVIIPRHPDFYRDTIIVVRKEVAMPVVRGN